MTLPSCAFAWAGSFPHPPLPTHHLHRSELVFLVFRLRAFHTGYRFGWAFRPPFDPLPSPPLPLTDEAHTARLPYRASTWVGLPLSPSYPTDSTTPTDDYMVDIHRDTPPVDTFNPFSAPKTFVGPISIHHIAAGSLASSGNDAVDTGAPLG